MVIEDDKIHIGQKGATFTLNIKKDVGGVATAVDLTLATGVQYKFFDPLGTLIATANATIINAVNGVTRYQDITGIFNITGDWQVQAIATYSASDVLPTSLYTFYVGD